MKKMQKIMERRASSPAFFDSISAFGRWVPLKPRYKTVSLAGPKQKEMMNSL
jgi:hypothetical protein